jgi:hypothetical protein
VYFLTSDFRSEDFLTLAAGAKKAFSVETAALHTLDDGGDFDVFAQGALPFANANSTELTGSLDYESNKLKMKINGTEAATVTKAIAKRSTVDTNCNRHQRRLSAPLCRTASDSPVPLQRLLPLARSSPRTSIRPHQAPGTPFMRACTPSPPSAVI